MRPIVAGLPRVSEARIIPRAHQSLRRVRTTPIVPPGRAVHSPAETIQVHAPPRRTTTTVVRTTPTTDVPTSRHSGTTTVRPTEIAALRSRARTIHRPRDRTPHHGLTPRLAAVTQPRHTPIPRPAAVTAVGVAEAEVAVEVVAAEAAVAAGAEVARMAAVDLSLTADTKFSFT
jgi:hypothetical protein